MLVVPALGLVAQTTGKFRGTPPAVLPQSHEITAPEIRRLEPRFAWCRARFDQHKHLDCLALSTRKPDHTNLSIACHSLVQTNRFHSPSLLSFTYYPADAWRERENGESKSVLADPAYRNHASPLRIVGYSATQPDGKSAAGTTMLQRQFGQNYGRESDGNTKVRYCLGVIDRPLARGSAFGALPWTGQKRISPTLPITYSAPDGHRGIRPPGIWTAIRSRSTA